MPLLCSYKQLGHHQEEMLEQQDLSLVGETQLVVVAELSEMDMYFEEQKVLHKDLTVVETNEKRKKMKKIGKERKKADGNKIGYLGKERKKADGNKKGHF
ncbi:hypothetical protein Tco_0456766 [Tanacetum coccineum]